MKQSIDEVIINDDMSPERIKLLMQPYKEGGSKHRELFTVRIQQGVASIGSYAFAACTGLTSVEIPGSVTIIGKSAFWGCTGLTRVVIPEGVKSIGSYAFTHCRGLTSVEIPNSVTSIGVGAFAACTGLISVEIPSSVTSIGEGAFYGCAGLTYVEISEGVRSIGDNPFSGCTGLTSVVLPEDEVSAERVWNLLSSNVQGNCIQAAQRNNDQRHSNGRTYARAINSEKPIKAEPASHELHRFFIAFPGLRKQIGGMMLRYAFSARELDLQKPWEFFQRIGAIARAEASAETGECEPADDPREGAEARPR